MNLASINRFRARAFTILEMMIVVGIIGLLAAMALPHLKGFTTGSAMNAATRQLLDDVTYARQRAMANRAQVCIVFAPTPSFWQTNTLYTPTISNLFFHQYSAYAMIALRSVGDQPGRPYVHYLTDWRVLPKGTFIAPFQFDITNGPPGISNLVSVTNTTTSVSNGWYVNTFPTDMLFPFPSTFNNNNFTLSNYLPYIEFTPSGQLISGNDQFIMLASGSIFYPTLANGGAAYTSPISLVETPTNNEFSNPNIIHIDWLTGRAKIERNQF